MITEGPGIAPGPPWHTCPCCSASLVENGASVRNCSRCPYTEPR